MRVLCGILLALLAGAGCHKKKVAPPVATGRALYGRMCAVCHGAAGEGYGADQAPRLAQPDWLASASDAFLRDVIVEGRAGTTMSAWGRSRGGPLDDGQVNALISFQRTWQEGASATLDEAPLRGDAVRGEQLYRARCAECHGERGIGGEAPRIGNADFLRSASNGYVRYAISRGRRGTRMPAFAATLPAADIDAVVAALRGFASSSSSSSSSSAPPAAAVPVPPPPQAPPLPLGPVPLHAKGPEPKGFNQHPGTTDVDVVKSELARGAKMGILDARAPSDYLNEHITGAVSVPFYDPTPYLDKLPKNAWLVCYCACPHAESGQLAQKLVAAGFKKVTVLNEGLGVWRNRQYPLSKGPQPGP